MCTSCRYEKTWQNLIINIKQRLLSVEQTSSETDSENLVATLLQQEKSQENLIINIKQGLLSVEETLSETDSEYLVATLYTSCW